MCHPNRRHPMTGQPMPAWLRQLLISQGHLTSDGAARAAHASFCRRCGAHTMIGLDHDHSALTARCDPQPLNALGEWHALLAGRATYALTRRHTRYELDHREAQHIQAKPAGRPDNHFDVLAEHVCENAVPNQQTSPSAIPAPARPQETDRCPF